MQTQTSYDEVEEKLHTLVKDLRHMQDGIGAISGLPEHMLRDRIRFYVDMIRADYGKDFSSCVG